MRRAAFVVGATLVMLLVCVAALAGPWMKLDTPIRTSDGREFNYEFFDNRTATGGGSAQTAAIKGVVTYIRYG